MRFFDGFANIHTFFVHAPVVLILHRDAMVWLGWSGADNLARYGDFGHASVNSRWRLRPPRRYTMATCDVCGSGRRDGGDG